MRPFIELNFTYSVSFSSINKKLCRYKNIFRGEVKEYPIFSYQLSRKVLISKRISVCDSGERCPYQADSN